MNSALKAVVFDAGETLINERRLWKLWADWLHVPDNVLFSVLGAVIERGEHHHRVFEILQPGFELNRAREQRRAQGQPDSIEAADLYPDAVDCVQALHKLGFRIGVAGNQPEDFEQIFRSFNLPLDLIASSARWGLEKPSHAFFAKIASELDLLPGSIAYVGDRLDNDILPAREAGFFTVFIRRGPWGFLHAKRAEADQANLKIENLNELVQALVRSKPA